MKFKKMLYAMLIITLLAIVTIGCSDSEDGSDIVNNTTEGTNSEQSATESADTGLEATAVSEVNLDKHYTISMFQWGPRDIHADDEIIKHINERFNIDFQVERILAKEYAQNLELKIAAGDMPDIFRYPLASFHIYSRLYEDGYLMNFAEYAEKYQLEGLQSYIDREGTEEYRESDGVYQMPSNKGKQSVMLLVRQDWLDQLGIPQPRTLDDFKAMLQAFKDNNLGGNNTVPLTASFGASDLDSFSASFTGVSNWVRQDDNWIYEKVMPEYKEFLRYVTELYQSRLIDQELFTANETQAKAKFVSGASGLYLAGANRYNEVEKDLLASNPNAKLSVIMPRPEGPKGPIVKVTPDYAEPVVAIKEGRDEDFLVRVAALLDFMHSEEGIHMLNFGIEGIHYNMVNNEMVTTEAYERDILPSLGHLTAMTTDYSLAAGNVKGVLKESFADSMKNGIAPPLTNITYGDAASLVPAVNKTSDDWRIAFMMGTKDLDADWDQYVVELNTAGLAELTAAVVENTKDWE